MRPFILLFLLSHALTAESGLPTEVELLAAQKLFTSAETKADGFRQLILIAGGQLFVVGGVVLVTSNPEADEIQRRAARIVKSNRQPELIRPLFDDPERQVRLWAVIGCVVAQEQRESWRPLVPLLIKAATQDPDVGVRSHAVDRVQAYGHQADLEDAIPHESSPGVLMRLYGFSRGEAGRKRWYTRAITELAGDPSTRLLWLQSLAGSTLNPSTAPMWRVGPDPGLIAALEHIARSGEAGTSLLAQQIIEHFHTTPADERP